MKKYNIKDYEVLLPPYELDFDNWNHKKAQDYLEWFKSNLYERSVYVYNKAVTKSDTVLDTSPEVLRKVWKWFLKIAEIEKVPEKEQKGEFGYLGESFISRTQLSVLTEFIIRDIAMLMSVVFMENHSCLYWDFDTKPKQYIFLNHPVIKGFVDNRAGKPFYPVFEPVHMVHVQASGILENEATVNDLINIYYKWESTIPKI